MRWDKGRALVARRRESICILSMLSVMIGVNHNTFKWLCPRLKSVGNCSRELLCIPVVVEL